MEKVYLFFKELLRTRIDSGVTTTEDSIRYTFYFAFTEVTGVKPQEIILEYPHSAIPKAHIDTYMPNPQHGPLAIEFKYDREIPAGNAIPRPQKAGELFKDMVRLKLFEPDNRVTKLLIYVTDPIMANYFRKEINGHREFFTLPVGGIMRIAEAYLQDKPKTFIKALGNFRPFDLTCVWNSQLPEGNELKIYKID